MSTLSEDWMIVFDGTETADVYIPVPEEDTATRESTLTNGAKGTGDESDKHLGDLDLLFEPLDC